MVSHLFFVGVFSISRKIVSLTLLLLLIIISGCSKEEQTQPYSAEQHLLGTDISVSIEGNNAPQAANEIFGRIKEIEHQLSVHIEDSQITKLNTAAGVNKVNISSDTFYVLDKAAAYSKLTGGAFDATVGPIIKLWGIGSGKEEIPGAAAIQKCRSLVDYKQLKLEKNGSYTAYLPEKGQAVDLGGIAKGYAGDEAKKVLLKNGINRGILNLGGNVVAVGKKIDGSLWRVGIQDTLEPRGSYAGVVTVADKSVVTSGGYERYFIKYGKQYHHIIDTRTGYPAENGLISVSIIAENGIDADALSTGVYVLGLEKGRKLLESLGGIDAVLITSDKKVYVTKGIKDSFKLTNKDYRLMD